MWSPFTECSVSCNGGTKTRYRKCNSPLPDPDGVPCNASEATDHVTCHEEKCPGKKQLLFLDEQLQQEFPAIRFFNTIITQFGFYNFQTENEVFFC